jgi:hypothetical protein
VKSGSRETCAASEKFKYKLSLRELHDTLSSSSAREALFDLPPVEHFPRCQHPRVGETRVCVGAVAF